MLLLSVGAAFSRIQSYRDSSDSSGFVRRICKKRGFLNAVVVIILIGFVPSYTGIPSGLGLIDYQERYGWTDLKIVVDANVNRDAIILADRATELAWIVDRKVVALSLSEKDLGYSKAGLDISEFVSSYQITHMLMDSFTYARWNAMSYLIEDPLSIGAIVPLSVVVPSNLYGTITTVALQSMQLVGATEMNSFSGSARIYEFKNSNFTKFWSGNIIGPWIASHSGNISETEDGVKISISENGNYTNTYIPGAADFNLHIDGGFLLFNVTGGTANMTGITLWDSNRRNMGFAEQIGPGLYYFPVGEVVIGDIWIALEGPPESYVMLESISAWQANPIP
jgi:hypothetical protein